MKMKISNKKYNFIIAIFLCILLSGCSWFGDSAEPENDSYEAGKKALNEGKFELAKAKLREITPESPYYPQAVWLIQKVPFKKGIDAYEKQQLEVAISEFSKVPLHGQDYSEAQHYLNLINYEMLYDQLRIASKTEDLSNKDAEEIKFNYDIVLITKLVNIAEKMGDSKKVLESFDIVISGIKHSSSRSQTEDFLTLLEKIVSRNKEKRIFEKALNFLLTDFRNLYQQAEFRPQVFQLVGNLKMELM